MNLQMRSLVRRGSIVAVLLLLPSLAGGASGELFSDNFHVRMFTLNAGGGPVSAAGESFRGRVCVGERGEGLHISDSYQMLAGYCPQADWFLRGDVVGVGDGPPSYGPSTMMANPTPNPSHGAVRFAFAVRSGDTGSVALFDIAGRRVRTLVENLEGPVTQAVVWDLLDDAGHAVAPGVYFVQLDTGTTTLSKRVVIVSR
jgi:hypothetical protein